MGILVWTVRFPYYGVLNSLVEMVDIGRMF